MILQVLHCPYCQETDIVKHGLSPEGKQRYRCLAYREGRGRTFLLAYSYAGQSSEVKLHIPRIPATQSMGRLPLSPREACHPVHVKAATWTTGRLPPTPGEACHHRSAATLGRLWLFCSRSSCQPRLPFPHGFAL